MCYATRCAMRRLRYMYFSFNVLQTSTDGNFVIRADYDYLDRHLNRCRPLWKRCYMPHQWSWSDVEACSNIGVPPNCSSHAWATSSYRFNYYFTMLVKCVNMSTGAFETCRVYSHAVGNQSVYWWLTVHRWMKTLHTDVSPHC